MDKSNILLYAKEIYDDNGITDDDMKANKLAILFINYNCNGKLGQPVINDGALYANNLNYFGYKCFFISNTTKTNAMKIIIKLISSKGKDIVFFYSGHGDYVQDMDGDEDDCVDEAFSFQDNEYLIDDEFRDMVNTYLECNKFICISNTCHSGTIYDVERINEDKRKRMICVSSCKDEQWSFQLKKNGLFSLQFWFCFDRNTKTLDIDKLNSRLKRWEQEVIIYPPNTTFIDF